MTLTDIIYSAILVSIPEVISMVYIALLFMRRFDFLDKYNIGNSLKMILVKVAIPCAIISNFTFYGLEINSYLRILINFIVFTVLMKFLLREITPLKSIFGYALISFNISMVLELFVSFIMCFTFNSDAPSPNSSLLNNILLSIPVRILQFSIIYMVYIKMNSIKKINILEMWECNLYFRKFVYAHSIICLGISAWIYSIFAISKYLEVLDYNMQLMVMILVFILLMIVIMLPWVAIFMIYPSEKLRNKGKINNNVKGVKCYEINR